MVGIGSECVRQVGLSPGRVSVHLACLADCGYVQVRRSGRFAWYKVADPRVADLVMLARSLAADNAAALADCVRIAPDPAAEPAARPGLPRVAAARRPGVLGAGS